MTLAELQPGDLAIVKSFDVAIKAEPAYRQKLLAMGLTPSTPLQVIRKAPLGDPIEIKVRNFSLSLRCHEAAFILVDKP